MKVEETLTILTRMLWVVDNAVVTQLPDVDDHGAITALAADAAEPEPVVQMLESALRPSNRGLKKVGLTLRVWIALLFLAAYRGRATVAEMHAIATGELPRELQWDLGILTCDCPTQTCSKADVDGHVRMLTERQLYRVSATMSDRLDPDTPGLSEQEQEQRLATLEAMKDAFLHVTHIFPQQGSSLAVDESGVWSWYKGRRKPKDMPDVDPTDEDANARGEQNVFSRRKGLRKDAKPIPARDVSAPQDEDADFFDRIPDEDQPRVAATAAPSDVDDPRRGSADSDVDTAGQVAATDETDDEPTDAEPRPKRICGFARWGVKTHKNGKQSSYYGYALHALIRVPDIKGGKSDTADEPLLIQQYALTSASTDVVDVTIGLVKKILAVRGKVKDLIGDRHYSYKKFTRWALPLWKLGVKPILDLRKDDHTIADYNGAQIIAGTPHCGAPQHLIRILRPGKGATKAEWDSFYTAIEERRRFAMARHKSPQGDGKTRWMCAARAGTVGCHRLEGSVEQARAFGLPIITPPEGVLPWCTQTTAQIPAHEVMKYQQEEYWGTEHGWEPKWNRRTHIEGAFGNMKNHHTGNIHRGFTCFTGRALMTLVITGAVVSYQLRELESWFERANENQPDNPLLGLYAAHPLHQRTESQHGFTMLTARQRVDLDSRRGEAA